MITPEVSAGELLAHLCDDGRFNHTAGLGAFDRLVGQRTVQRLGVDVTGYTKHLESDRVQLLGNSESGYLATLSPKTRARRWKKLPSNLSP